MVKAAVVGASGYAGARLLSLLAVHPNITVTAAIAHSNAGVPIAQVYPPLRHAYADTHFADFDEPALASADLVFIALPHGQSAAVAAALPASVRVVDLGADYRLTSAHAWQTYYGGSHAGTWVYGLADVPMFAEQIATTTRVANPGCYATALSLSLAPAAAAGLVNLDDVVAVASSGTSGAGRKAEVDFSATEVMGSMRAYKSGGAHQHIPEVEQTLGVISGEQVRLSFTPVLAPMPHGIHATVTAPWVGADADVRDIYSKFFVHTPFVSVLEPGCEARTADVLGTNDAVMTAHLDTHSERLVVTCVIDNLGKGAAAQAIHNANLMLGLPEATGLVIEGSAKVMS